MRISRKLLIAVAMCSTAYFGLGVYADSHLKESALSVLQRDNIEFTELKCDDLGPFGSSSGYCTVRAHSESIGPILEKLKLKISNCHDCERAFFQYDRRAINACHNFMRDRGLKAELILREGRSRLPQAAVLDREAGVICFCFQFSGSLSGD